MSAYLMPSLGRKYQWYALTYAANMLSHRIWLSVQRVCIIFLSIVNILAFCNVNIFTYSLSQLLNISWHINHRVSPIWHFW